VSDFQQVLLTDKQRGKTTNITERAGVLVPKHVPSHSSVLQEVAETSNIFYIQTVTTKSEKHMTRKRSPATFEVEPDDVLGRHQQTIGDRADLVEAPHTLQLKETAREMGQERRISEDEQNTKLQRAVSLERLLAILLGLQSRALQSSIETLTKAEPSNSTIKDKEDESNTGLPVIRQAPQKLKISQELAQTSKLDNTLTP
jgi:hypothetical protein